MRMLVALCACALFVTAQGWAGQVVTYLNANANLDSGLDAVPHLATNGQGRWIAVWHSNENLGGTYGTDEDIFFATSSDNGANWSGVDIVNHEDGATDSDPDSTPSVMWVGGTKWICIWSSGVLGDPSHFDIKVATSLDDGASWESPPVTP